MFTKPKSGVIVTEKVERREPLVDEFNHRMQRFVGEFRNLRELVRAIRNSAPEEHKAHYRYYGKKLDEMADSINKIEGRLNSKETKILTKMKTDLIMDG